MPQKSQCNGGVRYRSKIGTGAWRKAVQKRCLCRKQKVRAIWLGFQESLLVHDVPDSEPPNTTANQAPLPTSVGTDPGSSTPHTSGPRLPSGTPTVTACGRCTTICMSSNARQTTARPPSSPARSSPLPLRSASPSGGEGRDSRRGVMGRMLAARWQA